jgi:hypothetical protein
MNAAQKLIDLDAVVPGTFGVQFGGQVYQLPRSVPLLLSIRMMKLFNQIQEADTDQSGNARVGSGVMEELFDCIVELFQQRYPDMTAETLKGSLTLQQATILMREMVSEIFAVEEEQGNP